MTALNDQHDRQRSLRPRRSNTAFFIAALALMSCGKSGGSSSAPHLQAPTETAVNGLKATTWTKKDGNCGYGLTFEKEAAMFHLFYACRASPNQKNAMASFGVYSQKGDATVGLRTGITCPSLDSERRIEFVRAGDKMTVQTASEQIVLTLQTSSTQVSNDAISYGCLDSTGKFTAHDWQ